MVIAPSPPQGAPQDNGRLMGTLRAVFNSGRTRSLPWRLAQLNAIERMLTEAEAAIVDALAEDLGRSPVEAWLGDIASVKVEVAYARKHVKRWMRRRRVPLPMTQRPGRAWVQYEPLGAILIIGPWNYPVYLTLAPLVAAVAAGNCAVIKPSELAPATSALLAGLVAQYLDSESIRVVEGDASTTQDLLDRGFDHAVFTGGGEVGRKVMAAAASTLTPVTLELGGKCPVIVLADADLDVAARRIAASKLMNSGQTCIAPDYVLADKGIADELITKVVNNLDAFRSAESDPSVRIVNQRHFDRLVALVATTAGTVRSGGGYNRDLLRFEPTVIVDPSPTDAVMAEEIFGPILPILRIKDADAAVELVKRQPNPLALYVFTGSAPLARQVIDRIPSGSAVINHIAVHTMVPSLPFGGVGGSGMGAYHGHWGFETLSHRRAVLAKRTKPDPRMMYPPYTGRSIKLMRRIFL